MKRRKARRGRPPKAREPDQWAALHMLIAAYADARVAESWKGGGDPADMETIELRLKLAHVELQSHIEKLRRKFA